MDRFAFRKNQEWLTGCFAFSVAELLSLNKLTNTRPKWPLKARSMNGMFTGFPCNWCRQVRICLASRNNENILGPRIIAFYNLKRLNSKKYFKTFLSCLVLVLPGRDNDWMQLRHFTMISADVVTIPDLQIDCSNGFSPRYVQGLAPEHLPITRPRSNIHGVTIDIEQPPINASENLKDQGFASKKINRILCATRAKALASL